MHEYIWTSRRVAGCSFIMIINTGTQSWVFQPLFILLCSYPSPAENSPLQLYHLLLFRVFTDLPWLHCIILHQWHQTALSPRASDSEIWVLSLVVIFWLVWFHLGHEVLDQDSLGSYWGQWESERQVHTWFEDCVDEGYLWEVLRQYGILGTVLQPGFGPHWR